MSNILARCTAVGIVAGGFALTGDLGLLAERGLKVINASDVPAAQQADAPSGSLTPVAEAPALPTPTPPPAPASSPAAAPAPTTTEAVPPAAGDDGELVRARDFVPPSSGVTQIDIAALPPGGRIVAWLTTPRGTAGRRYRCLVFDLVDPATGEALAYEAVSFAADGSPQATAVPPSRVRIAGSGPRAEIVAGGMIHVERRGIADGGLREAIGPVAALDLIR